MTMYKRESELGRGEGYDNKYEREGELGGGRDADTTFSLKVGCASGF